jgi:hypothetical protein
MFGIWENVLRIADKVEPCVSNLYSAQARFRRHSILINLPMNIDTVGKLNNNGSPSNLSPTVARWNWGDRVRITYSYRKKIAYSPSPLHAQQLEAPANP